MAYLQDTKLLPFGIAQRLLIKICREEEQFTNENQTKIREIILFHGRNIITVECLKCSNPIVVWILCDFLDDKLKFLQMTHVFSYHLGKRNERSIVVLMLHLNVNNECEEYGYQLQAFIRHAKYLKRKTRNDDRYVFGMLKTTMLIELILFVKCPYVRLAILSCLLVSDEFLDVVKLRLLYLTAGASNFFLRYKNTHESVKNFESLHSKMFTLMRICDDYMFKLSNTNDESLTNIEEAHNRTIKLLLQDMYKRILYIRLTYTDDVWSIENHKYFPPKRQAYVKHVCKLKWSNILPEGRFIITVLVLPFIISRYDESTVPLWIAK